MALDYSSYTGSNATLCDVEKEYDSMADKLFIIEAPLTGTFYRRPSPEDPPFLEVGQEVKEGDVTCIVESMKVFTEVRTERGGIVRTILVEDEDPVQIHQALIEIEAM